MDVRTTGGALHADLAGPVGADVGVERRGRDLGRLGGGRRRGQLRVQEARGRRRSRSRSPTSGTTTSSASAAASRASASSRPRWRRRAGRVDDGGPDPLLDRSPGSRCSEAQATESRISIARDAARRSPRSARRRSRAGRGCRSVASITTGSRPPSVQRQSASTVWSRHPRGAVAVALRAHGVAAAVPGDVGRDPDRLAGPQRDGDERLGQRQRRADAVRPMPRVAAEDPVDARRQVDGRRAVAGRRRHRRRRRGGGIGGSHSGTSSALTRGRRARRGCAPRRRRRAPARSRRRRAGPARAARLDVGPALRGPQRRPLLALAVLAGAELLDELAGVDPDRAVEPARCRRRRRSRCRRTRTPRSAPASSGEPAGWRAISRRRTIRWRGVVVRSRLGQTGSQKPHSTQVVGDLLDRRRRLQVLEVHARGRG